MEFWGHRLPLDSGSMTFWQKRVGSRGFEALLGETLCLAEESGQLRESDYKCVNVDTIMQEKNITHPTDAKLFCKGIELLARNCKRGIKLRQTYVRLAPKVLRESAHYAQARKYRESQSQLKRLRTLLGQVLRDMERKALVISVDSKKALEMASRTRKQKKRKPQQTLQLFCP